MSTLGALTGSFAESFEQHVVELHRRRCLRSRLSSSSCSRCCTVCPTGALTLSEARIHLDVSTCSGCLRCCSVCPADALLPRFDVVELAGRITAAGRQTVISCHRQAQTSTQEISVPCFGLFSLDLLLYLGIAGSPKTVVFKAAGCAACTNRVALDSLELSLQRLAEHVAPSLKVHFTVDRNASETERDLRGERRSFFQGLGNGLVAKALGKRCDRRPGGEQDRQTARRPGQKTRFLQAALSAAPDTRTTLREVCTYDLRISDSCSPCPRCAGICPTGALRRDRTASGKALAFKREACSGCGLCVSFCQADALTLVPPPLYSPPA